MHTKPVQQQQKFHGPAAFLLLVLKPVSMPIYLDRNPLVPQPRDKDIRQNHFTFFLLFLSLTALLVISFQ